ncbi:TIGR04255 family protein [Pseudomonas syringae]|uniref:TIGR04255 family protein n=1 Tax=Pseudomonas syringae TaxID=317 RepID=UPI000464AA3C|nr:TIGR04255 family protein [Pseudomonas syringae]QGG77747.1 TIGR04255 family protein [Pseudomonas syringae USA011]
MTVSTLFEPINRAHAVVETVFFFEFLERVIHDEASQTKLRSALARHFTRVDSAPSMEFTIDLATGASLQKQSDALNFIEPGEGEGEILWMLRVNGLHASLHCLDYTRWDNVFEKAVDIFKAMFGSVKNDNGLVTMGLKVLDRFEYLGAAEQYNIEQLFSRQSVHLTEKVFESDNRWHVHTGWFSEVEKNREILNQLSIDSSVHTDELGATKSYVTIDHASTLKGLNPTIRDAVISFRDNEEYMNEVSSIYRVMHESNKKVVLELLQPQVSKRLNLVWRSV